MSAPETEIRDRLNSLPSVCGPVVNHARRYLRYSPSVASDGTLNIGYTPWVAPEAYAFHLFAPAQREWLGGFSVTSGHDFPNTYSEFLLAMNGCFAYGLSLYGLPASLQAQPRLLDRSKIQPLDLDAANRNWRKGFPVSETEFHFAVEGGLTLRMSDISGMALEFAVFANRVRQKANGNCSRNSLLKNCQRLSVLSSIMFPKSSGNSATLQPPIRT
jgi:hypothetical protein